MTQILLGPFLSTLFDIYMYIFGFIIATVNEYCSVVEWKGYWVIVVGVLEYLFFNIRKLVETLVIYAVRVRVVGSGGVGMKKEQRKNCSRKFHQLVLWMKFSVASIFPSLNLPRPPESYLGPFETSLINFFAFYCQPFLLDSSIIDIWWGPK